MKPAGGRTNAGQTATEYMLILSVIVCSLVAAAYLFIPEFQGGVAALAQDVSVALATGQVGGIGFARSAGGTTTASIGGAPRFGGPGVGGANSLHGSTQSPTMGNANGLGQAPSPATNTNGGGTGRNVGSGPSVSAHILQQNPGSRLTGPGTATTQ